MKAEGKTDKHFSMFLVLSSPRQSEEKRILPFFFFFFFFFFFLSYLFEGMVLVGSNKEGKERLLRETTKKKTLTAIVFALTVSLS